MVPSTQAASARASVETQAPFGPEPHRLFLQFAFALVDHALDAVEFLAEFSLA